MTNTYMEVKVTSFASKILIFVVFS